MRPIWKALLFVACSPLSAMSAEPATMAEAQAAVKKAPPTAFENKCRALIRAKGSRSEAVRLKEIFDLNWSYLMTTFPEWATYTGYKGQNARWSDSSFSAIALQQREARCPLEMIKSVNRAKLNEADKLNYDLFK